MNILIYSDKISNYNELCGAAESADGSRIAFAVCGKDDALKIPADRVFYTDKQDGKLTEDYFDTLKQVVLQEKPDAVFISASKRGRYIAAKLSAVLKTSALTDLNNPVFENGGVKGSQMYYGGLAQKTVKSKGVAVVTIGTGTFEPVTGNAGETVRIEFAGNGSGIKCKEIKAKEGRTVNLSAAKCVVGVGRGFTKKEDLELANTLAKVVNAEIGCTRPIAEGEGWLESSRYIGVSGIMLKPNVYFAVGISGQIQHLIGINSAKTIIAINKDKNAPIFKACDYGIVADLTKVLPELTELIKA